MQKEKSTGELLNEIAKSDEINLFLQKNEPSLSYPSVASCLAGFLRQKQLSKAVLADRSGLDRVYDNSRARAALGWQPRHDFAQVLQALEQQRDFRSALALQVGSKGYHDTVFAQGPYPVD